MSPGRPPFYTTVEELQAKIDEYFDSCKPTYIERNGELVLDKNNHPIIESMNPPTVTGLAFALGFTSRQALINYQEREPFVDTVTRAKLRIEKFVEGKLFDPAIRPQGPIFALKNLGWRDASEVAVTQGGVLVVPGQAKSEAEWEAAGGATPEKP